MAAMGRGDVVVRVKRRRHSHGHGLFAGIQVNEPGNLSGGKGLVQCVFKGTDNPHLFVHRQQTLAS